YTAWPQNTLEQIRPGSAASDKSLDLTALGVASSVGAVTFVPGSSSDLRIVSYDSGRYYSATLTTDGLGTFDLSNIIELTNFNFQGPEAFLYVPNGSPDVTGPSILLAEWNGSFVAAYDLDSNGVPVVGTRRPFAGHSDNLWGLTIDPVTGDLLISTNSTGI